MPYCELLTTCKVDKAAEATLNREFSRVIELIPGKSERWVMTHIEDEAKMCFAGDNEADCAMVTVKTFGELEKTQYDLLTKEFCESVGKCLNVPQGRVYVTYQPVMNWGWNGENF